MFSILTPQLAAFLAALAVTYGAKHGLNLEQDTLTATFVGVFALVKTVVGKYTNPGNVNAPELVDQPKEQVKAVRRASARR